MVARPIVAAVKILVCGTGYGQMYLDAAMASGVHTVVGLFARGSERSQVLASSLGIPLVTSIDDLPRDVDLACVAIGSEAGTAVSEALLRRGVPVLREHVVPESALDRMLTAAAEGGTVVHVNAHFGDLDPAHDFVVKARWMREVSTPLLIQISADAHLFYATLDIVGRVFGDLSGHFEAPSLRGVGPRLDGQQLRLAVGQGVLAGIPVVVTQGRSWGKVDDGSMSFFGDELAICFSRGRLVCQGFVSGAVVLTRNSWGLDKPFREGASSEARSFLEADGAIVSVSPVASPQILDSVVTRMRANLVAVEALAAHAGGGPAPVHQTPEYLRALIRRYREATGWAPSNVLDPHPLVMS